jgi:hypothetical protein
MKGWNSMTDTMNAELRDFNLLSRPAQQRLRARVADAHGNIETVAAEVRAQLAEHERAAQPQNEAERGAFQADRAFLVAQLVFLDALASAVDTPKSAHQARLMDRLRTVFHHRETAK